MKKGVLIAVLVILVILIAYGVSQYNEKKCQSPSDCPMSASGVVGSCHSGPLGLKWCTGGSKSTMLGTEGSGGAHLRPQPRLQPLPSCSGCGGASSEASSEAQTLAVLNGAESFAGSGRRNWPSAGVYGHNPGTYPYGNYAGYSGSPGREKMSTPQFEWGQVGTFGHSMSNGYPYYAYSGSHGGVYPTMQGQDDSYHW